MKEEYHDKGENTKRRWERRRQSWSLTCSERWLHVVSPLFIFSSIPLAPSYRTFDYSHELPYFTLRYFTTSAFLYSRLRSLYSWTQHLADNSIALLLLSNIFSWFLYATFLSSKQIKWNVQTVYLILRMFLYIHVSHKLFLSRANY